MLPRLLPRAGSCSDGLSVATRQIRHCRSQAKSESCSRSGITLFNGGGLSAEAELIEIFRTIEEHHGEYSHTPALSDIEVFGAHPTPEVRAELSAYGFDDVSPSQRGSPPVATRDGTGASRSSRAGSRHASAAVEQSET